MNGYLEFGRLPSGKNSQPMISNKNTRPRITATPSALKYREIPRPVRYSDNEKAYSSGIDKRRKNRRKLPPIPLNCGVHACDNLGYELDEIGTSENNISCFAEGELAGPSTSIGFMNKSKGLSLEYSHVNRYPMSHRPTKNFKWISSKLQKTFRPRRRYDVNNALADDSTFVSTIHINNLNSYDSADAEASDDTARLQNNFNQKTISCSFCWGTLAAIAQSAKRKIIIGGRRVKRIFIRNRKDIVQITPWKKDIKVVYLGNVSTILCKGDGSTDIAVNKIWKSSCQGDKGIPMLLRLDADNLTLLCHQVVKIKGIKESVFVSTAFKYRRITHCAVDGRETRVLAWIYRHENKFKSVRLRCHALQLKDSRKASDLVNDLRLQCRNAHVAHQRQIKRQSSNRTRTPSIRSPSMHDDTDTSIATTSRCDSSFQSMQKKLYTICEDSEELI